MISQSQPGERPTRLVIMGAAGRDFHNFNVVYRQDPTVQVVAFTAAQIEGISDRTYPPSLAGPLYPEGIPILPEAELDRLCQQRAIDQVVFAYSDLSHDQVMHRASQVLAQGADFLLLGPHRTMIKAPVPVIAVSAVRTGCGKSQVSRWLSQRLQQQGRRLAVIRHPMPYGDLERQRCQRFAQLADLATAHCTLEEREEYEPHLAAGNRVYAGVDYGEIVAQAAQEADLLLWDGGNNDFPLLQPDLHIVLVDALRPGHETGYHPGEAVLRMADIVVVAKADMAPASAVQELMVRLRSLCPQAPLVRGGSPLRLEGAAAVQGQRVIVVEDGPTTTHGGMAYGAGYIAATQAQAATIVDPRPFAPPAIARVYQQYPQIGPVLPAMGYSPEQLAALGTTLNHTPADLIVSGTPIDLAALLPLNKPIHRVHYEFADLDSPGLGDRVAAFLASE
ncbi:MAG: cyclic 2,3-diphosphoglycerate synthase [Cyanobacteriota bacterium]|nr:cyclic 2,3-diphosphoglycerate synthase [Cyanobacteriota bacterium]